MENQHEKIKGYRDLSQEEIDAMNECKELAALCGKLVDKLNAMEETDKRWVSIGTTDIQKGFMSIIRSIAKPTSF